MTDTSKSFQMLIGGTWTGAGGVSRPDTRTVRSGRLVAAIQGRSRREFAGMGHSGHGRESGSRAVPDDTRPKPVWMNLSGDPLARQVVPR